MERNCTINGHVKVNANKRKTLTRTGFIANSDRDVEKLFFRHNQLASA